MINVEVDEKGKLIVYNTVISDSVKFEKIKFNFPESWDGYIKTAMFRNGDIKLGVILDSRNVVCTGEDECFIPHEVIKAPEFTVSVFGILGSSRVTSTQASIRVKQSGYGEGDVPPVPTPPEYRQLIILANETKQIAQSVRDDADNGAFRGDPFTYADFTDEQLASLKGKDGADGKDGYTPQKGVDYFTEEDIASLNIPSVDQTYNPDSKNAQSGKAVAEAVATKADKTEVNQIKDDLANKEPLHKVLSATLVTGETSLTFTDAAITDNAMIYIYTNVWGVQPSAVEQSGNTLTLTFDAQSEDLGVKVEVW